MNSVYSRGFRALTMAASITTFLLVVVGGIVRVTGSGLGCPDWPLCYGQVLPPPQVESIIEWSHRFFAAMVSVMVVAIAVAAWRLYRSDRRIVLPAVAGVVALAAQIVLGKITVDLELPPILVAIHLGTALVLFACVLIVATHVWTASEATAHTRSGRISPLALATAIAVYALILLGATVVNTGASLACTDWPLCQGQLVPPLSDPLITVHVTHRFAALASGILATLLFVEAWHTRAQSPRAWRLAAVLFGLFVVQVLIGGMNVLLVMPIVLRALHLALAALVWGVAVILFVTLRRNGVAAYSGAVTLERTLVSAILHSAPAQRIERQGGGADRSASARAMLGRYVRLTKPWIIALLLTTTLMSMLIAGKGSASLPLIVFTLLGGALASSGANAINCYIDRDIDGLMSRTKNRPLPREQVKPGQALLFGLTASAASFVVLAVFVNLLAATLAVFGIIYYVFVYTRWLKRSTPHNIVIGGIAGAVPPLVGWAAVTGRIDLLALYLFLIVFYWTPPHTWALTILVRGDYEKAGVPMLPVVRGDAETRRQIWLYSLQLVAVTLLIFAFRLLGWVYLALAMVLNGLFLWLAFRLTRDMDKPAAKRLYKYSQLYLALLFTAMVIDAGTLS